MSGAFPSCVGCVTPSSDLGTLTFTLLSSCVQFDVKDQTPVSSESLLLKGPSPSNTFDWMTIPTIILSTKEIKIKFLHLPIRFRSHELNQAPKIELDMWLQKSCLVRFVPMC